MMKAFSRATLMLLVISISVFAFSVDVVLAEGSWVWVRDTVAGAYGEAVVGTGAALYIARGAGFYRYTPSNDSFVELAAPPKPDGSAFKTGTSLAWDFGDYIYALYGAATGDSRRYFYRYSISQNVWERLADTPYDQGEGDSSAYVGRVGLYATVGGEQRPTHLLFYNVSANVWDDAPANPPGGMGDGASLVWAGGDCLYALRGEFLETQPLYDFWRYNLTADAWSSLADIPAYPHDGGIGGVGDGGSLLYIGFWMSNQTDYIYALSGNQAYPEPIPDNRTYRYKISTNSWERLADLPFGVGDYVGCRLGYADGHIYAWQGTPSTWAGGGDDLARYVLAEAPVTQVPLFRLVSSEGQTVEGGINATLTFQNYGFNASSGSVWIPWEKLYYGMMLSGSPPTGSINESLLTFDVNGDGDTLDVFPVRYVDNETVEVDGVLANVMLPPENRIIYDSVGQYDIFEMNSFTLGSKNFTVYRIYYDSERQQAYVGFGLDSFFHYHPSPNILFVIEQVGTSINAIPKAEIVSLKLNGTPTQPDFSWTSPGFDESLGVWLADKAYVFPVGFLQSNDTFTVQLSIQGEPGNYAVYAILNWAPNEIYRYRYIVYDACEAYFSIPGTLHKSISFEGETYPLDITTNSTILREPVLNAAGMEISFKASGYMPSTYFWNVSIPKSLLRGEPWTVTLDGNTIPYISTSNETHTFIYFTYNQYTYITTSEISIKGTWVVPELPSTAIPTLPMLTTLFATVLLKKKRKAKP
ncbi:MAG: hypothetical protein ACP5IM_01190 [Candidatus Bathyarchaeia archaeon]